MADIAHSESVPQPRPVPDELAAGLDLFAATWLQQWSDAGGSVCIQDDGKAQIGFPMYHDSPEYVTPAAELPDWSRRHQETFADGAFHGKMRALLDLLQALPCGGEALKRHMRLHGMRTYFGPVGGRS